MVEDLTLDLSRLPRELVLLLLILRNGDEEDRKLKNEELYKDICWDKFLELTYYHAVYPIVYLKLKKLEGHYVPEHIMLALYKSQMKNTFRMLYLSQEMGRLCKLFAQSGIRAIVLKGPIMAVDLYGDISLRTSVDLDILVSIDDLKNVDNLLTKSGYEKEEQFSTILDEWKWRHHHFNYFNSKIGMAVEIHWRLNPGPAKEPGFNELWERKRTSSLTGYPINHLGEEDLFFMLVLHGARHGWYQLKWLVDVARVLNRKADYYKLAELLKKNHCLHVGGQAVILASQLLGMTIDQDIKSSLVKKGSKDLAQSALFYMLNFYPDRSDKQAEQYLERHLFQLMSNWTKLVYILSLAIPYSLDAEMLPLPKQLHFLYFVLRPFSWAWRKIKK